jgi:hypothetical protein
MQDINISSDCEFIPPFGGKKSKSGKSRCLSLFAEQVTMIPTNTNNKRIKI